MGNVCHEVSTRLRGLFQLRNGVWREDIYGPFYADPYPLSEKGYLVAGQTSISVLDGSGAARMAYGNPSTLRYASRASGTWSVTDVPGAGPSNEPVLALDGLGHGERLGDREADRPVRVDPAEGRLLDGLDARGGYRLHSRPFTLDEAPVRLSAVQGDGRREPAVELKPDAEGRERGAELPRLDLLVAQLLVAAAALASENKSLAHPASVDSLPTSAKQEDHVSMSTFAARRLGPMAENTRGVLAIELLAAAQGIDFRAPERQKIAQAMEELKKVVEGV